MRRIVSTLVQVFVVGGLTASLVPVVSAVSIVTLPVCLRPEILAVNPQTGEILASDIEIGAVCIVDGLTSHVSTVRVGAMPSDIAVNRVTGFAYVANSWGSTVTAVYGYGEGKKRKTYAAGVGSIHLAVNATTNRVYVVNNEDGTVTAIDENSGTTTTIPVGERPWGIAVNEVTNRIYVTNIFDNTVTVIDGSTNVPLTTLAVGDGPYYVAVNPVTNRIYVTNNGGSSVTVIDGDTNGIVDVPVGQNPVFIAVNTVTNKIYVSSSQAQAEFAVIDGATSTSTLIDIPPGPLGFSSLSAVVVNEVTNRVYLGNPETKSVIVVDGVTNALSYRALEFAPGFIAINAAINTIYVSHFNEGRLSIITE